MSVTPGKEFPLLASPIQIGPLKLKNRIFMAPMDTGFGNNAWGGFTPEGIEYFVRRAQGGFALLFTGGTATNRDLDGTGDTILEHAAEFTAQGRELNERLDAYGCRMFVQLTFNLGRNAGLKTPSPLPFLSDPSQRTQQLSTDEIRRKIETMGRGARLCKEAGFPGVDIHALHWGHLLDSFALSYMNDRTDQYGGSLENRLRPCREILEAIRSECGSDYPVTMRFAMKSYMKGFNEASFDGSGEVGRTIEEAVEAARLLEAWGYSALSTDTGTLDSPYYAMPPSYLERGYALDLDAEIRKAVSIPILAGARMADPEIAEQAIRDGIIDAIVVGRQAIADPDFARQITSAHPEKVRTCIGCNQGCIWGYTTRGKVGCAVNPEVGLEIEGGISPAPVRKKILIAGGGVAGMEAARVARLRGHDVTLLEQSGVLGGNLIPAGAEAAKVEVSELREYYIRLLQELGVKVQTETTADATSLRSAGADVIVLATGSTPVIPHLPGFDHPKTVSAVDVLNGRRDPGENVVIVGGGLVGCEIALDQAKRGRHVTIVEALDSLMQTGDVPAMNKALLLDAFDHYGVERLTGAKLQSVGDDGASVLLADGTERLIPADTVIMSVGYRPRPSMRSELSGCGADVYEIGDGSHVSNIMGAIHQAYEVMRRL